MAIYKLGDITKIITGNKNKEDANENGKYPFYTRSTNILRSNDFTTDGTSIIIPGEGIFTPLWNNGKAAVHQRVYVIKSNSPILNTKYLYYWWLKNNNILYQQAVGSTVGSLRKRNFENPTINLPTINEQQKIIDIIEPIDNLIENKIKEINNLEQYKKGLMQKLFNTNPNNWLRFKDEKGNEYPSLKESSLSFALLEFKEKNINNYKPVAIGRYGIRMREEIYSRELSKDYTKNKVIRKNTFIFGMGSKQIDYGILLDDKLYCVSNAYKTFIIKDSYIYPIFLKYLFFFHNKLLSKKFMIVGTRQGKSIDMDGLLKYLISIPCLEEQQKIGNILLTMDEYIKKNQKEKIQLEQYKKGLMQILL